MTLRTLVSSCRVFVVQLGELIGAGACPGCFCRMLVDQVGVAGAGPARILSNWLRLIRERAGRSSKGWASVSDGDLDGTGWRCCQPPGDSLQWWDVGRCQRVRKSLGLFCWSGSWGLPGVWRADGKIGDRILQVRMGHLSQERGRRASCEAQAEWARRRLVVLDGWLAVCCWSFEEWAPAVFCGGL